jgi:hypothetical protein
MASLYGTVNRPVRHCKGTIAPAGGGRVRPPVDNAGAVFHDLRGREIAAQNGSTRMGTIKVTCGAVSVTATLHGSNTARLIEQALPITSRAQRWGDEVYFSIPIEAAEEDAQAVVPPGTVAYWPPGRALCLFFGQTPYSPVNVVGSIAGDATVLAKVKEGDPVEVVSA